jgi:hypothetical protein
MVTMEPSCPVLMAVQTSAISAPRDSPSKDAERPSTGSGALDFGNGGRAGPLKTLFFTTGIQHEQHGLFGSVRAVGEESTARVVPAARSHLLSSSGRGLAGQRLQLPGDGRPGRWSSGLPGKLAKLLRRDSSQRESSRDEAVQLHQVLSESVVALSALSERSALPGDLDETER